MAYRYSPNSEQKNALRELRSRVPRLHPYAALTLTLEPMLLRDEISSRQYLQLAAMLIKANNKPMFSPN